MKTAIQRFGYTCVAAMVAVGITGSVFAPNMSAQSLDRISVNLPEDVTVGSTLLPAGSYTIQDIDPASGNHLFVFRGENNKPIVVAAAPTEQFEQSGKTAVVLTKTGDASHLDKLLIEGSSIGYAFNVSAPAGN